MNTLYLSLDICNSTLQLGLSGMLSEHSGESSLGMIQCLNYKAFHSPEVFTSSTTRGKVSGKQGLKHVSEERESV